MRKRLSVILAAIFGLAAVIGSSASAVADQSNFSQVERGLYLTRMGDCTSCHTRPGGKPFSGGLPLDTPFGTIYSSNITPDKSTGIGNWSDKEFLKLMREGIGADGKHIYPAMPYQHFTTVTDDDVSAIRAYLDTLDAVSYQPPANKLIPPLNVRESVAGWNMFYLNEGPFKPEPNQSAAWNRGAYLIEGLGHCGGCHTPLNMLGAEEADHKLEGAKIQNWTAPSLVASGIGIGKWSNNDVIAYLKTGQNRFAIASGPMSEVVDNSLRYATDDDLSAMAIYLKDKSGSKAEASRRQPDKGVVQVGSALFRDNCSACHGSEGKGQPGLFTDLRQNGVVSHSQPAGLLHVILAGAKGNDMVHRRADARMPAFGWKLTDAQIAAIATYMRASFGNVGSPVYPDDVDDMRTALKSNAG